MQGWRESMPQTWTDRVCAYVISYPGHTAWEVTKALSDYPERDKGTVSSLMCRMARDGRLTRRKNKRGSWVYHG